MSGRKNTSSFHISTVYKLVEIFLICFLNKNSIKRKKLESYLLKGEKNRRIGFKDVYLPLIKKFDLPITEKSISTSIRGRFNPVIWEIDLNELLNDFLTDYFSYLSEQSLILNESKELIQIRIREAIHQFQSYWNREINLVLKYSMDFPFSMAVFMTQSAILDQGKNKLIKYLPIFFSISFEHGRLENYSEEKKEEEIMWVKAIQQIPSYLDMIGYFYTLLLNEWTKAWPSQLKISPEEFLSKTSQKIFIDHIDTLYYIFKENFKEGKPINFLFNPGVPRNESFWTLFFAFKEPLIEEGIREDKTSLSNFVLRLKKERKSDYDDRVELFFKIIFKTMISIFSPDFSIEKTNYLFLGQEDLDNNKKVIFSLKKKE